MIAVVLGVAVVVAYYFLIVNSRMSLEDAVGQMLMVGFYGETLQDDPATLQMLQDVRPGGVILFDRKGEQPNITSPEQVQKLTTSIQANSKRPVFVAVDAEGGYVNRFKEKYGFSVVVPSAEVLGEQPASQTRKVIEDLAVELKDAGVNWNLAPVVDVNLNPEGPAIGWLERSFSSDPDKVVEYSNAFLAGLKTQNIIPSLKHFPGHGSADKDTHLGITDVTETYERDVELAPYKQLITSGYNDPIMTAHIVNGDLDPTSTPATLSAPILTGILRDELNFKGVVISDDMQMGAIVEEYELEKAAIQAVQAGVDIVLITNNPIEVENEDGETQVVQNLQNTYKIRDALIEAVNNGTISKDRIYKSVDRIVALKKRYDLD